MQWVIYCIAQNPDVQERLHAEVTSVVPRGEHPTQEHVQNMPYLRGVIKEVLRWNKASVWMRGMGQYILIKPLYAQPASLILNHLFPSESLVLWMDPPQLNVHLFETTLLSQSNLWVSILHFIIVLSVSNKQLAVIYENKSEIWYFDKNTVSFCMSFLTLAGCTQWQALFLV